MRIAYIVLVILLVVSSLACAQERSYMGIFTSADRSTWCINEEVPVNFDIWLWVLPSERGIQGVRFQIPITTSWVRANSTTFNSIFSGNKEDLGRGDINVTLISPYCHTEWTWILIQHLGSEWPNPLRINIMERIVFSCQEGNPEEDAVYLSSVFLNYGIDSPECTTVGVEVTSWGAIKSLYR